MPIHVVVPPPRIVYVPVPVPVITEDAFGDEDDDD
jgi:hypothetical protein